MTLMLNVVVLAVAVVVYLTFETFYLKRSYYLLSNESNIKFTVAQLSDIHGRTRFINGSISEIVNKINPDYVVITGDLASKKKQLIRVFEELRKIKCHYIFFVPGNYEREWSSNFRKCKYSKEEYEFIIHTLQHQGITVLENSGAMIGVDGKRLFIYGFDNSIYGNERLSTSDENWQSSDYKILLAHSPSIIKLIDENQLPYDLLLVGHTHGGQIRLFDRTIGAYKNVHVGLKQVKKGKFFYINRGLGTVKIPIRVACRPEIAVFQIGE
jgi:predicted MPP superfamily phosphohydrolase